jgi:hypothetical protein
MGLGHARCSITLRCPTPGYRVTAIRFSAESLIISLACGPRLPRDSCQSLPGSSEFTNDLN